MTLSRRYPETHVLIQYLCCAHTKHHYFADRQPIATSDSQLLKSTCTHTIRSSRKREVSSSQGLADRHLFQHSMSVSVPEYKSTFCISRCLIRGRVNLAAQGTRHYSSQVLLPLAPWSIYLINSRAVRSVLSMHCAPTDTQYRETPTLIGMFLSTYRVLSDGNSKLLCESRS